MTINAIINAFVLPEANSEFFCIQILFRFSLTEYTVRGLVIPMFDGVSFVSPQLELGQVIIKLFFFLKLVTIQYHNSWFFRGI